ncbi:hypothetical protein MMC25_007376 [Agyrium rufum]|nr:hypothetical protein [Agyrium rufum]
MPQQRKFVPALVVGLSLFSHVKAHSWVQTLNIMSSNGSFTGDIGYPRGYVPQYANPAFNDGDMVYLLPPDGTSSDVISSSAPICKSTQQKPTQSAKYPRLQAQPGDNIALQYEENGHVTLPQNQKGKPTNRGTVYIYGTSKAQSDDKLMSIHKVWNTQGTGGDKRGKLVATRNFDDGQCWQKNGGDISVARQSKHPIETPSAPQGDELWCQNDLSIPMDAETGKPYTLYWVWDWPTLPNMDPGLPKGKLEMYTTCMDVDITSGTSKSNKTKVNNEQHDETVQRNPNSAGIPAQLASSAVAAVSSTVASLPASVTMTTALTTPTSTFSTAKISTVSPSQPIPTVPASAASEVTVVAVTTIMSTIKVGAKPTTTSTSDDQRSTTVVLVTVTPTVTVTAGSVPPTSSTSVPVASGGSNSTSAATQQSPYTSTSNGTDSNCTGGMLKKRSALFNPMEAAKAEEEAAAKKASASRTRALNRHFRARQLRHA